MRTECLYYTTNELKELLPRKEKKQIALSLKCQVIILVVRTELRDILLCFSSFFRAALTPDYLGELF